MHPALLSITVYTMTFFSKLGLGCKHELNECLAIKTKIGTSKNEVSATLYENRFVWNAFRVITPVVTSECPKKLQYHSKVVF